MHCQAVKDEYISRVNLSSNPFVSHGCFYGNLWDMKVLSLMGLNTETVRAFENP